MSCRVLSVSDLPGLMDRARAAGEQAAAAAVQQPSALSHSDDDCTTLPEPDATLSEAIAHFINALPPVEEVLRRDKIPRSTVYGSTAAGTGNTAAAAGPAGLPVGPAGLLSTGLPSSGGCREVARDVCVALLRLSWRLVEAERVRVHAGSSREAAAAVAMEVEGEAEEVAWPSGALVPWSDPALGSLVLAAEMAPHALGFQPSDGRWEGKGAGVRAGTIVTAPFCIGRTVYGSSNLLI